MSKRSVVMILGAWLPSRAGKWLDVETDRAGRADLDGSNRKVLLVAMGNLAGIAYVEAAGAAT
jgi:Low-density lipoprotein receptor repeat class B